ncbi:hypothetical protein LguiA_012491 [Lonicera macranthoides]
MEQSSPCIKRRRIGEREDVNLYFFGEKEDDEVRNLCELVISDHVAHLVFLRVLFKLPVNSIFKFKSVSKSCLSMISHPNFSTSYCRRIIHSTANNSSSSSSSSSTLPQPTWTLLCSIFCDPSNEYLRPLYSKIGYRPIEEDLGLRVIVNDPVFKSPGFKLEFLSEAAAGRDNGKAPTTVLAVSNGLLLTSTTNNSHDCYYVCNPLTQQWCALPKPPRIHKWVAICFIVEPCDGSFQVVRLVGDKGSPNIVNFEIFLSKTCQWKEKSASFDLSVSTKVEFLKAVPCKQIIYWTFSNIIIAYDSSQSDSENDETIQCRLIDLPRDRVCDWFAEGMIGVCQDKLHYLQAANGKKILSIWELTKYNDGGEGEWFLSRRITYSEINPALPELKPIALHPFSSDLVYITRSAIRLASLNLRSRVVKSWVPLEPIITWWTFFVFVLPMWPTPVPQMSPDPV